MKICIYGGGAIGGLIGARLAQAGHAISVVARGTNLTAILKDGIRVRSSDDTVRTFRVDADENPDKFGLQDYVIVAVKGQNLPDVAAGIGPLLGPETGIVTAMNGVPWWFFDRLSYGGGKLRLESLDPDGALSSAMPTSRVVGCVVHLAASTPEPGVIRHNMGERLILGEPGGKNSARTQAIVAALREPRFEADAGDFNQDGFSAKLPGNINFHPGPPLTLPTPNRLIEDDDAK